MATAIPSNVDEQGTFLLSGKFINQILDWMRENTISVEDSSPIKLHEIPPNGKVLTLDTATCS